jgi:hypothetical protein
MTATAGFIVFLIGANAGSLSMVAAAVLSWAAAIAWARYASRVARRYRVEKNVVDGGEFLIPAPGSS